MGIAIMSIAGVLLVLFVWASINIESNRVGQLQALYDRVKRMRRGMPDDEKTRELFDSYHAARTYMDGAGASDRARAGYELQLAVDAISRRYVACGGPAIVAEQEAEQARKAEEVAKRTPANMPLRSPYSEEAL